MNESEMLAKTISEVGYNDIPARAIDMAKMSLLDALAVTLAAGGFGEGPKQFIDLAIEAGGRQESSIIGFDVKVPSHMAAFANGAMAHTLDFEDAHDKALVHPNAATVPAALAIAESLGNVNGKDLITSIVLGSDLVCRLGLALRVSPLQYGWYIPPIFSAFGAAATACKLMRLDSQQIINAFSLNLCQATCSAQFTHIPSSLIRGIRDAFSTKAGVLSALLAQRGVSGFDEPLEGKAGLFALYARGNYDPLALTNELGKTFEGANVSFKPWPSCRGTHPYIDGTLRIINENNLETSEIEQIKLTVSPVNKMLCEPLAAKQNPQTAIDAKFSLPYVVATALVHRGVALEHFLPERLRNEDTLRLAKKVTFEENGEPSIDESMQGFTEIRTRNGDKFSKGIEFTYGHPSNPMSHEALITKFVHCAAHAATPVSTETAYRIVDMVMNLEEGNDINVLTGCL
ncbi:MAG: MmgE/PrpD family protein [Dehalococcoidia bacterium]